MIDTKVAEVEKSQLGIKIGPYWEFARPHTIIGTTVTVLTLFLISLGGPATQKDIIIVLLTLISSLFANVYIVGLNQIYDIEIDKINKPYLPMPSGLLNYQQAKQIILFSAGLSILLAIFVNIWLFLVVVIGMFIGTIYSIPFTRYKTNPTIAAFSIAFVRGVLGNIGLYLVFKESLSITTDIFPIILFLTVFVLVFSFAIALAKDIPDLEGDKQFNIMTFTVRMGRESVFNLCVAIFISNYVLAMISSHLIQDNWNQLLMVSLHGFVLILFYLRSQQVDLLNKISVWKFYQKIWHFFYLEYLLLILVIFI